MKSHRSRRVAAGAALVLSLTLAGCAEADPGAAGRVGDRVVPEQDVLTTTQELSQNGLGEQIDTGTVTRLLVLGPVVLDHLKKQGIVVSDDDGRRLLPDAKAPLSPSTLLALRTIAADNLMREAEGARRQPSPGNQNAAFIAKVGKANQGASEELRQAYESGAMQINPKYFKQPVDWVVQDQTQQQP